MLYGILLLLYLIYILYGIIIVVLVTWVVKEGKKGSVRHLNFLKNDSEGKYIGSYFMLRISAFLKFHVRTTFAILAFT